MTAARRRAFAWQALRRWARKHAIAAELHKRAPAFMRAGSEDVLREAEEELQRAARRFTREWS